MPLRLLLWLYMRGFFRCWLNCSFQSDCFWTGHHYYFLSWQPLSPWWILSNGLFSSVHIHPHFSVFFLLFLQLLHGALVREHWGDGCKYLIVGDFLAAGHVPHFRRGVGNTNTNASVFSPHRVLIKTHKRFMQYVVWVFRNSGDSPHPPMLTVSWR